MKWSKKSISVAAILGVAATIAFAGPFKDRAGRLFDWWLGGVKQMELYDGQLRVDKISNIAMDAAPDFPDGLNLSSEPTLVAEYMTATTATGSPVAGKFYSEIVGREPMLDLSKIPSGKHGVERIAIESFTLADGEIGPNGHRVFRLQDGRISIAGEVVVLDNIRGKHFILQEANESIEIVFYGTGLNLLTTNTEPSTKTYDLSIDGGATTAKTAHGESLLNLRGYAVNSIFTSVSGLAVGVHTAIISNVGAGDLLISGFEILNDATTVAIPAGSIVDNGRKYTTTATTDDLTTFENEYQDGAASGSSTKGGHQVRYFDVDGTIKKDINYADTTQLNLAAASHVNEEIAQKINFREFGSGRADDFSTLTNSPVSDRAFTLDDGTTTLVGDDVRALFEGVTPNQVGDFLTITFVGSGIDLIVAGDTAGDLDDHEYFIDGNSIGTISVVHPAIGESTTFPVVSGLPFGTHTLKVNRTVGAVGATFIRDFIIYAPKKPVLADGQVEIDSTYKLADYVAVTGTSIDEISQGVIAKQINQREAVYFGAGTWIVSGAPVVTQLGGWEIENTTGNTTTGFSYTGFFDGFDWRGRSTSARSPLLVELDSGAGFLALNTTNFPSLISTDSNEVSLNTSTGEMDVSSSGSEPGGYITVTGLPLAEYTVRFKAVSGSDIRNQVLALHMPTYSFKNNLLNLDDSIVGSNTLKNEILIPGATKHKIIATAGSDGIVVRHPRIKLNLDTSVITGAADMPFNTVVDSSTFTVGDWSVSDGVIVPKTGWYRLTFYASALAADWTSNTNWDLFINGVGVATLHVTNSPSDTRSVHGNTSVYVTAGTKLSIRSGNSQSAQTTSRFEIVGFD